MLGISYGELFLIIGATAALIGMLNSLQFLLHEMFFFLIINDLIHFAISLIVIQRIL